MARLNWRMERLENLLRQTSEGLGYDFWGLEYVSVSGADTLRLYIEGRSDTGPITPDDCAQVSLHISSLLEVDKPISGTFSLEVSSPGMERRLFRLEQCQQAIGERIRLRLRPTPAQPGNSGGARRNLLGQLLAVDEASLKVRVGDSEAEYAWDDLERVQIAPDWQSKHIKSTEARK